MSEQGGNGVRPGNGKGRTPHAHGAADQAGPPAAGGPAGAGGEHRAGPEIGVPGRARAGWGRYLVAPRPVGLLPGGVSPIEASALFRLLEEDPDVEPVAQVHPSRSPGLGAIAEPYPACPPVAVVKMPQERARALAQNPQVIVEIDQPLSYTPTPSVGIGPVPVIDPMLTITLEEPERLTLRVVGGDGQAVAGAHVWAIGTGGTVHGTTDPDGHLTLTLAADTPDTLRALYVRPVAGYWPTRTATPRPADGQEAVARVQALSQTFEGFPGRAITGWGIQAMRLHQIPPTYRGHGIKIALLDSGVNTTHPDLKDTVKHGHDFTGAANGGNWRLDVTGHGTWCAGIITAADNNTGITGIAAEAELHALKLFPGGHLSNLLEAIDYCTTHTIDIAQISLAHPLPSQLAAWKLADAHAAGITIIAPAGDTAGPLTQPATLPMVLAVGALAHTGTYPTGSPLTDVQPPWPGPYPAPFTPTDPGVDLLAPGAAVITTGLNDGYTAVDGTAIAAAHVTGLAALVLAHYDHPRTQSMPRTVARADRLHLLLRTACRPLPGADFRLGPGIPDAPALLGIPTGWQQAEQYTATGWRD